VLRKICAAPKGPLPPALPGPDAEDAEIEAALSHPAWMFRMFSEILGHEEAVSLCLANNLRPPLAIRAAGGPPDRNGVSAILKAEGIETGPGYFAPQSLIASGGGLVPAKSPSFAAGLWTIQDEAAQVVSLILGPKPGETVLDACAAPGGKTAHIAELMDDSGSVIALDKSEKRLGQLRGAAERMGLRSITILAADASKKLPFPAGHFDRILLDAPCSSIGTVRRSPEIKWRLSPRDPGRLSGIQTALLCNLADYLKPGGVLVYSVCTVARDECEDVVGGFIGRRPEFGIEPPRTGHGRAFPVTERGTVRTWPHLHGADGFFIARMIKRHPRGDPPWSPPVRGSP
jgi:16S rRNA (cytosine967-C5)-methyltransferase